MGAFHESAVVQGGRSEEAQSKRSYRSLKNTSNYPSRGREERAWEPATLRADGEED